MEVRENEWQTFSNDQSRIYYVEKGSGELYASTEDGQRYFFRELSPGSIIITFSPGYHIRVSLIALEPMNIREVAREELLSLPLGAVERLAREILAPGRVQAAPRFCEIIKPGSEYELKKGSSIMAPRGEVLWVRFLAETAVAAPRRLYMPEGLVMISSDMAVTVENDTCCIACRLEDFAEQFSLKLVWQMIFDLVNAAGPFIDRFMFKNQLYFQQRYEQRQQEKKQFEQRFERQLLGWVNQEAGSSASVGTGLPPIIFALRQIAAFFGMDKRRIVMPEGIRPDSGADEIIRQIISANEIFGRRVRLEADWQRHDQGPLLVFKNGRPGAALPSSPEKYELVNEDGLKRQLIDEELAGEFDEYAYVFFRKVPEDTKSLKGWLGWAAGLCWQQDYLTLIVSCLLVSLFPLVIPLITQTVFDDIIPSYDAQAHLLVVQVMLVTLCAQAVTTLVRDVTVLRMKNNMRLTIEPALWIKLLDLPPRFFRRYTVGDLSNRMQGVSVVAGKLSGVVSGGIFNGVFAVFTLIVMGYFSLKLSGIACLVWLVYLVLALFFAKRLLNCQRQQLEATGAVWGKLVQIISGLDVFKLYNAEERALELWAEDFGTAWKWNRKARWQSNYLNIVNILQPVLLNGLIFFFTINFFEDAYKTRTTYMSTASFMSFYSAMGIFGTAIAGFFNSVVSFFGLLPTLERLQPIIAEENETGAGKAKAPELRGEVILNNVSFRYKPELPLVLKNINMTVGAGSFTAIVGASGCGKSSLLRLILGLETPEHGIVEFDGYDLAQLDMNSVRRQMGVVLQRGRLMAGTILSNIIGSLPLTAEDAWLAAEEVGLAEDIRRMPMGMDTYISEDGSNISGGQKQRILIARAIVNHARIIVFDEATSSLDNETQREVSETLERLRATRIVVAHRLSTIRNADNIIVLDSGSIVEQGSYEELMEKDGYFKALAARQLM